MVVVVTVAAGVCRSCTSTQCHSCTSLHCWSLTHTQHQSTFH